MKIKSLKLYPVSSERQYGTVIAREGGKPKETITRSYFFFIELTTDTGLTGWGEISDVEQKDMPKDVAAYAELLRAFTVGRNPYDVQQLHHDFLQHFDMTDENSLSRYTQTALDMAFYDLQGKATGRPIFDLLGGKIRSEVVVSWVAYIREDLNLIREEIRKKTAEGFHAYKLKVGVDIDLDEERLAVAREVAGKNASIKVDANEGWNAETAVKNIRRLNKYNLAGVETPVPREDPRDIAAVRRQVDVPILEHVKDLQYGVALAKAEAVDAFNIATTGSGGLWGARQIVGVAQGAGIGILLGSTVEMGLGTLAQLHLAATIPNLTLPSDLIGPGMYQDDILTRPLGYRDGKLDVPQGPGLGGEVDRKQLSKLAF